MSEGQRRRLRRKRRMVRGMKKTFINVVFAPARIPKIKQESVDLLMRLSEIAAVTFAAALVAHIASPDLLKTGVVVFFGVIFTVLLSLIKLSEYQEKIEQYRYYGFRI